MKKLVAAQARGVDVRAVLTMRGDVKTMNKFSALTANALLKGGVRVYLYPAMTHVKAMAVEPQFTIGALGSFELNFLEGCYGYSISIAGPAGKSPPFSDAMVQAYEKALALDAAQNL